MGKKNHNTSPMTQQMAMFDVEQSAPQIANPELGIRRVEINSVMYFSVLDIFKIYGDTTNPTVEWAKVQSFLVKQGAISEDWNNTSSMKSIELLLHQFTGERQRPTPIATFKMVMRIAQVTTFKGWESVRDQMARLANERVEEIANPELGIERAQDRFIGSKIDQGMSTQEAQDFLILVQEGKVIRRQWTDVLKRVVRGAIYYGTITNAEYEVLFGMTAKQITDATGFKPARNGMTRTGRQFVNLVECALEDAFNQQANLTFAQAVELTKEICAEFSVVINKVESRLGISLATGQKLLGGGR